MILLSLFEVNNFVKIKGAEKEEYMISSHREDCPPAERQSGNQDHGRWLLNRMPEPGEKQTARLKNSAACIPAVGCPVAVYVTEPRVMLWGGRKSGAHRIFQCHIISRN